MPVGWRTGKALWDAGGGQDGVAVRQDDVSKTGWGAGFILPLCNPK
ncbi:hypothetical protein [Kamptonema formosum]|nr:hypothetical protein [Oscillatoria sp. PCC 10802]